MTHEELIAALENATGADKELDAEIAPLLGWVREKRGKDRYPWWYKPSGYRAGYDGYSDRCPAYTESLDAALTLVPEGWNAVIYTAGGADVFQSNVGLHRHEMTYAPTPAIALCIAALKARGA